VASPGTGPGPWLRLTAIAAVAAHAVVVVTGEWPGSPHNASVLGALALTLAVAAAVFFGHRDQAPLVLAAAVSLGLLLVQIAVGGVVALTASGSWASGLHIGLGALSVAAMAVTAALTGRSPVTAAASRPRRVTAGLTVRRAAVPAAVTAAWRPLQGGSGPAEPSAQPPPRFPWRDYVTLTKPRIMVLLLLTAGAGTFVGARGVPSLGLLATVLGGLALACGGASALNHLLDRDIDVHMKRTDRRPVATGRVAPERALEFGLALSALSFVVLASFANVLAALLAVFGNLFYVLVYTRWLKRSTPQNIVIGGAAGAVPAVVGWAAATGNLALPALFLFLIVFYWTPPHFWALALLIRRDYEAAKVPMLPVVHGERRTAVSIVRYTLLMIGITLLPFLAGDLGWVYLGTAIALGAVFLALALRLLRDTSVVRARSLFTYSLTYLALLFVAMAVDPVVLT
jgi:protoheme IX farnesyltransferase